jgi:taurine dioxygenase
MSALQVVPLDAPLGADIRGIDIGRSLAAETVAAIRRAWLEHIVLRFRDQSLDPSSLIAFGRNFGELHASKGVTYGSKPADIPPEVELITTLPEDNLPPGNRAADENVWHTDMSFHEVPASASLLYAQLVPPSGGNTWFTNLYRAYDTLPEDLRRAVEGRRSIHDAAYTAMHEIRAGYAPVADKSNGPGARHPVVRTHPETGRKALYLGRAGYGYIEGYDVEESDRLLERLWAHMTQPRFVWEQAWQAGDLIMWDNRACAHGRTAVPPDVRRRLIRVTVKGEKPQ